MDDLVRSQYRIPVDVDEWLKAEAKQKVTSKNAILISSLREYRKMKSEVEKDKAPTGMLGS